MKLFRGYFSPGRWGIHQGCRRDTTHASTPRTPHLTVTFDQREEVHCIKRNAHTGWLWCLYFLQTPTQSFPSISQTWEGLHISARWPWGLSGQLWTPVILSIQFNPTNTSLRKGDSWIRVSWGEGKGNNSSFSSSDLSCQTQTMPAEGLTSFLTLHWLLTAWVLCLLCGGLQKFPQN